MLAANLRGNEQSQHRQGEKKTEMHPQALNPQQEKVCLGAAFL